MSTIAAHGLDTSPRRAVFVAGGEKLVPHKSGVGQRRVRRSQERQWVGISMLLSGRSVTTCVQLLVSYHERVRTSIEICRNSHWLTRYIVGYRKIR